MQREAAVKHRPTRQYFGPDSSKKRPQQWFKYTLVAVILFFGVTSLYRLLSPVTIEQAIVSQLKFDESLAYAEKRTIAGAVAEQIETINGTVVAYAETSFATSDKALLLDAYVPVTSVYSPRQLITAADLIQQPISIWHEIKDKVRLAIAEELQVDPNALMILNSVDELQDDQIAIVPAQQLSYNMKLLAFEGSYYLDTFKKGAIFRSALFTGGSSADFAVLTLPSHFAKQTVLKINQTGVTALTRGMMKKLNSVNDPLYFSKNIGSFLADADITHVSNEVSFDDDCEYSVTVFCSDPRFIETLKASGVDLVELTGNHNNDTGRANNASTIELYHSLGWQTVGGGLNTEEAAKFYVADQKQTKVAFLAYNLADSPGSGAISRINSAGANKFDFDLIKTDIQNAKQQADFVIVDVQFWECYAYPEDYGEYPRCDVPIAEQEFTFKKLVDLGADMVVGTQAHQTQIYELYADKPIYYGLGNLYFDQRQWPGTRRGLVLTHYFADGKLIQTKLSPTIFDVNLQTALMNNKAAVSFLSRLNESR